MKYGYRSLRAALLATAASGLAVSGALAQDVDSVEDDEDEYVDEIVVTGFKAALNRSTELKRNSGSIAEAISAEEIGKLPDVSIAESLARLPGLAAQRLRGRAQQISVRGLGPDFTSALLNGREQVSAGDNRGIEFDQYPSELIGSAVVYKTPQANLIGQGLAGTVDLRTLKPLDYSERTISVAARYEFNDLDIPGDNDDGYRLTGTFIDQYKDGTVGLMLGFAVNESPSQAERFNAWGYPTITDLNGDLEIGDPTVPIDATLAIGGAKPFIESRSLERTAIVGALEFEPTDTLSTTFDGYFSNFKDEGTLNGIETPLVWGGLGIRPGATIEDGLVTAGTFGRSASDCDNVDTDGDGDACNDPEDTDGIVSSVGSNEGVAGVIRNDYRARDADVLSLGWNTQWQFAEGWEAEFDLSHSSVKRDDLDLESYTGTGRGSTNGAVDNLSFVTDGSTGFRFVPDGGIDYGDPSDVFLTDPNGWGQVGFVKEPQTDDELTQLRAAVTREFLDSGVTALELGVNHTMREKSLTSIESFIDLDPTALAANGIDTDGDGDPDSLPVPSQFLSDPISLDFLGFPSVISYDSVGLLASGGVYSLRPNTNADVLTKTYQVEEDVTTLYAQATIEDEWLGLPVTGNAGVQYVLTDQSSTGNAAGQGVVAAFTDGADYSNVLPSLNLSFELREDLFLRVGAARTLARARMDQLRASQGLGINQNICTLATDEDPATFDAALSNPAAGQVCIGAGGGSPTLRPYLADNYDLSLERYFGDGNYVSLAVFYRELDDYILDGGQVTREIDATNQAIALFGADFVAANPEITRGSLSQPTNVEGGNIQGVEVAANVTADTFTDGPLGGFGIFASYSYTDSEIDPAGNGETISIPGLSEHVANVTLFYELQGFEARISNRYRSDFLGEIVGFGAARQPVDIQAENVVDAQIGYRFESGPAEGLSVILQANNLTDEEFTTIFNGDDRQIRDYEVYGTTYLLGVNYTY